MSAQLAPMLWRSAKSASRLADDVNFSGAFGASVKADNSKEKKEDRMASTAMTVLLTVMGGPFAIAAKGLHAVEVMDDVNGERKSEPASARPDDQLGFEDFANTNPSAFGPALSFMPVGLRNH